MASSRSSAICFPQREHVPNVPSSIRSSASSIPVSTCSEFSSSVESISRFSVAVAESGRIGAPGDRVRVSVSRGWKPGAIERDWKEVLDVAAPGALERRVDLSSAVEGSLEGYWLRVEMLARDAERTGLDLLKPRLRSARSTARARA